MKGGWCVLGPGSRQSRHGIRYCECRCQRDDLRCLHIRSFRVIFLSTSRTLSSNSLVSFIGCNSIRRGGSACAHHPAILLSMAKSRTSVSSVLALKRKHIIRTRYFSDVCCLLPCLTTSANALCHPYRSCFPYP